MAAVLQLLGVPFAQVGEEAESLSAKQTALLAMLAERHPKSVTRDYLAELLWPAAAPSAQRHSLAQALYTVRKRLGRDAVAATASSVELTLATCDLWSFRTSVRNGAYERAAELIRGEFCENLIVSDCAEFEQWLDNIRREIRESALSILGEQIETGTREALSTALSVKLHTLPLPGAESETALYSADRHAFVGRVLERRALDEAWERSKLGEVAAALVIGEPGVGKTTLCTRVVKKAILQGARSLTATGYELQRNLPYGVVTQLLKEAQQLGWLEDLDPYWGGVLAKLLPLGSKHVALNTAQEAASDDRFAGAVCHLMDTATSLSPVTIFVDDAQWADSASMGIIHYLTHHEGDLPLFVLIASRVSDTHALSSGGWSFAPSLSLQGLRLDESRILIEQLNPFAHPVDVEALHQLSSGNPFLLRTLLANRGSSATGVPASVKHFFKERLNALSGSAITLGAAISAVGEPLAPPELSWVSGLDINDIDSGLRELMDAGIVEVQKKEGAFVLNNDILGEVVLDSLSPVASARLHGRVARLLRDRGSPAAIVATQMTIAGDEPETCFYALQAARASAYLFAYKEAEHFFRIALGTAATSELELQARVELARIYLRQGRAEEAETLLKRFTRRDSLGDSDKAVWEAHLLITQLSENCPPTFPRQAFRRALELEELLPAVLATELYVDIAANAQHGLHNLLGEATQAAWRTLKGVGEAPEKVRLEVLTSAYQTVHAFTKANLERLDELTRSSSLWPATYVACLSASSFVRISQGFAHDAERHLLQALRICEQYGFLDQRLRVLNNLGVCLLEQGRLQEAEEQFSAVARSGGSVAPKEIPGALNNLLITEYEKGDFESTLALGRKHLREPSLQTRLRVGLLGVLGLASLKVGRLAQAREYENLIHTDTEYGDGLSNDVSYVEIFLARMAVIDGKNHQAEDRLREKVDTFASRDFYCAARMEVELLRTVASHSPGLALEKALELRPSLAAAHAAPLVTRLDGIVARCQNHLRN